MPDNDQPDNDQPEADEPAGEQVAEPAAVQATPAPKKRGGRRKATPAAPRKQAAAAAKPAASALPVAGSLAAALRELVTSIEDEVAEVTRLSEVIDDHVGTLNGLRADVAERLAHLDELRAAADDANLGAFLDDTIQPQLPQQNEDFPDRIYGS